MKKIEISINQFAEFSKATDKGKKRILSQQIVPNKFLIPWYQGARAAMKKYLVNVRNYTPIHEAIEKLNTKEIKTKRQSDERKVSIEALNELKSFIFPRLLKDLDFEIIKPIGKNFAINNLSIIVAPDVVLKAEYNGKIIYGAIKVHICKTKPFDEKQSRIVSNLIFQYLGKIITKENGIILPELCLCLDIFGQRIVPASEMKPADNSEIKAICEEVKKLAAA